MAYFPLFPLFTFFFLIFAALFKSDIYEDHANVIVRIDVVPGINGMGTDFGAEPEVGKTY
jgi:hypothetical protein